MLQRLKEGNEASSKASQTGSLFRKSLTYLKKLFPRFKNKRLNHIAYPGLMCLLVMIFMFQNCEKEGSFTTQKPSTASDPNKDSGDPTSGDTPPSSGPYGSIIAYLASDTTKTPKDQFNTGQNATLEFIHFKDGSDSFKWTVQRGFAILIDAQVTNQPIYNTSFNQKGNHDVFATSHVTGNAQVLSRASKRLTIGQECDPADILEIKLQSGSLVKGQSVNFNLENNQSFTNINWKVQQPSQNPTEYSNQSQITVNLDASASTITLEVTAVDVASNKSQCLIYRKKEFPVYDISKPQFDFVRPVDDVHPIILENNDIYKYKRTSQSKYIQVYITQAHKCNMNDNPISCGGGKQDITQKYLNTAKCDQSIDVVKASYFDSSNTLQTENRSFYHFCPKDKDLCYFGPLDMRPIHHYCKRTPASTESSGCSSTQISQGYKEVNGQCLPSCSIAGGTHTGSECVESDAYDLVLLLGTYETACCKRTAKEAVNGVCNNAIQNSCTSGTPQPQTSSGGYYRWHCLGQNGGTDATDCQQVQSNSPINGQCNILMINGCSPGNLDVQPASNGYYIWHCRGINGGTDALNCQKPFSVDGICNNAVAFTCQAGVPDNRNESASAYTWTCQGGNGGTTVTDCRKDKVTNGQCNDNVQDISLQNIQQNGCLMGTPANTGTNQAGTHYVWHCNSTTGGTHATDCQQIIPIDGQCNNSIQNGCLAGTPDDEAIDDSNEYYKWYCRGQHGGEDVRDCQLARGSRCNYPDSIANYINTCRLGATFSDKADDNDHYKWACTDAGGKEELCQRLKDFHGECSTIDNCNRGVLGTVSTKIEDYATSGYYILPELSGDEPETKSEELNKLTPYQLSTLDHLWSCEGGLSKVYCRATKAFAGECFESTRVSSENDFINHCKTGYVSNKTDNQQQYSWWCYGTGQFSSSKYREQCHVNKLEAPPAGSIKSQGECSKYSNKCRGGLYRSGQSQSIKVKRNSRSGNSIRIYESNVTIYNWECVGSIPSSSGPIATTQKCKRTGTTFNGECDNTNVDSCAGGVFYDLTDSDTHYRWMCFGQNANSSGSGNNQIGGHIVYCSKPKFQVIIDDNGNQATRPF